MSDVELVTTWRAIDHEDREVMALPLGWMLRFTLLNHWYHHRGQLSVYLLQAGGRVPSFTYEPRGHEHPYASIGANLTGLH